MAPSDVAWVALLAGLGVGLLVWWLSMAALRRSVAAPAPSGLPRWWRWMWPLAQRLDSRARRRRDRVRGHEVADHTGAPTAGRARGAQASLHSLGLVDVGEAELRSVQRAAALLAVVPGVCLAWQLGPLWVVAPVIVAWAWPTWWLRAQLVERRRAAARALPFALDMMTLCLEAGLHFQGAVQQAVDRGPPGPLRDELRRWLGDVRSGSARVEALRALGLRLDHPAVRGWVQVMIQADGLGMSLGGVLRAQADQRRAERFVAAEKLALQAPVKMLFPLILCIFPCSFLILGFPVAVRLLEALG